MKAKQDKSQYGNQKGMSVQHYLVKMINKILTALDKNSAKEAFAVIANLVDWRQAFDRQDPKLAIKSFITNGVRHSLIPVLINYFQNRKMHVKWNDVISKVRDLPGGGPQGCQIGMLSYLSQSNDSASFVQSDEKYKFVDDLSILEVVNLISIGITSYNFKMHVASDIGIDMSYLPPENIKSSDYLKEIAEWTDSKLMKLNEEKSHAMIFNYTKNYKFSTRLTMNNFLLDIIDETKLLGVIISPDLAWRQNTKSLVKRGYSRIIILQKLFEFDVPEEDLVNI